MAFATKVLDLVGMLAILTAGIYVEIAFADILASGWKLIIAALVLAHVSILAERELLRPLLESGMSHKRDNG